MPVPGQKKNENQVFIIFYTLSSLQTKFEPKRNAFKWNDEETSLEDMLMHAVPG